eukprot:6174150-Pleurochrysis_carterae.AAC.1
MVLVSWYKSQHRQSTNRCTGTCITSPLWYGPLDGAAAAAAASAAQQAACFAVLLHCCPASSTPYAAHTHCRPKTLKKAACRFESRSSFQTTVPNNSELIHSLSFSLRRLSASLLRSNYLIPAAYKRMPMGTAAA